jgi:hypothetical protein
MTSMHFRVMRCCFAVALSRPNKQASQQSGQQRNFVRKQLPICPAKALTVHAAQGKTLPAICVDLPLPARQKHAASMLYVAFSRARRLDDIVILRPFKLTDIQHSPSEALFSEINRLRQLETKTLDKVKRLRALASFAL